MYNEDEGRLSQPSVDVLLPELARFPCLKVINFHRVIVSSAAFEQFCIAAAPRLQVLLFESTRTGVAVDPLTHVGLLHQLRVLVVDAAPPLPALLQLHQLAYLHVDGGIHSREEAIALSGPLRHLSASHALRSLSFGRNVSWIPDSFGATAPPSDLTPVEAALIDWSQIMQLTDVSFAVRFGCYVLERYAAIPTMTRLQAIVPWGNMPPLNIFVHLQQLRLQLDNERLLPHVTECKQLRVLQLCFRRFVAASARSLCAIVSANATTLEELRVRCSSSQHSLASALEDDAEGADKWSVISTCVRLRVLELSVIERTLLTHYLLVALAKAPAFQSLDLTLADVPSMCRPQIMMLPSALFSSSWCSIRLLVPMDVTDVAQLLPPSTLAFHRPSAASLHRFRVIVRRASHSPERCFILCRTNDGDGPLGWQCEY